jgi:hypothetical protein
VAPIDPLAIIKIGFEDGPGRPVRLNLELHNITAKGLSKSEIETVR